MSTCFYAADGGCGFKQGDEVCRRTNGQIHVGLDGSGGEKALASFALLPGDYKLIPEGSRKVISLDDLRKSCREFGVSHPDELPLACSSNHRPGNSSYGRLFPTDPYEIAKWWAERFMRLKFIHDNNCVFEGMTGSRVRTYTFRFTGYGGGSLTHTVVVELNCICSWSLDQIYHKNEYSPKTRWWPTGAECCAEFKRVD